MSVTLHNKADSHVLYEQFGEASSLPNYFAALIDREETEHLCEDAIKRDHAQTCCTWRTMAEETPTSCFNQKQKVSTPKQRFSPLFNKRKNDCANKSPV